MGTFGFSRISLRRETIFFTGAWVWMWIELSCHTRGGVCYCVMPREREEEVSLNPKFAWKTSHSGWILLWKTEKGAQTQDHQGQEKDDQYQDSMEVFRLSIGWVCGLCVWLIGWFFETGSHLEAQAGLELPILLPHPSLFWDYRHACATTPSSSYLLHNRQLSGSKKDIFIISLFLWARDSRMAWLSSVPLGLLQVYSEEVDTIQGWGFISSPHRTNILSWAHVVVGSVQPLFGCLPEASLASLPHGPSNMVTFHQSL
jgi:hypothetical protein